MEQSNVFEYWLLLIDFCSSVCLAYKPKFAEPKKTAVEQDRYDRDLLFGRSRYDDRDDRHDRRGGAPGGYPYHDHDRGL